MPTAGRRKHEMKMRHAAIILAAAALAADVAGNASAVHRPDAHQCRFGPYAAAVGPRTSRAFARNVMHDAANYWRRWGKIRFAVNVYSPVTQKRYRMLCAVQR